MKWVTREQNDLENFRFDSDEFHSASGTSACSPDRNVSIKSSSFCSSIFRSFLSSKQSKNDLLQSLSSGILSLLISQFFIFFNRIVWDSVSSIILYVTELSVSILTLQTVKVCVWFSGIIALLLSRFAHSKFKYKISNINIEDFTNFERD